MVHSQQFNSTCSWEADQRGPHQKIIGYSIYGELSKHKQRANRYLSCLKETLRIIPKAYPGNFWLKIFTKSCLYNIKFTNLRLDC